MELRIDYPYLPVCCPGRLRRPFQPLHSPPQERSQSTSTRLPRWPHLHGRQWVGSHPIACSHPPPDLRHQYNSAQKGGFFGVASAQGLAILFPDTSPRGAGAPGEEDSWDFGTGAGFYVNATKPEYSKHYNMYTHITTELPEVIKAAGLPIVCHTLSTRHDTFSKPDLDFSRTLPGNLSLDIVWVAMGPLYCICPQSRNSFAQPRLLPRLLIPLNAHGEKRPLAGISLEAWRREPRIMMQRS